MGVDQHKVEPICQCEMDGKYRRKNVGGFLDDGPNEERRRGDGGTAPVRIARVGGAAEFTSRRLGIVPASLAIPRRRHQAFGRNQSGVLILAIWLGLKMIRNEK